MKKHLFLALIYFIFSTSISSTESQIGYASHFMEASYLNGIKQDRIFFVTIENNQLRTIDLNRVANLLIAEFKQTASIAQQQELIALRKTFPSFDSDFLLTIVNPPQDGIDTLILISFNPSWQILDVYTFLDNIKKIVEDGYADWLEKEFLPRNSVIIINPESFSCLFI